jgi:hypothetical protein
MQQHQPSIPIANAAMPAAVPPYRTTRRRCLAIVALGLTAALFFSPIRVGPWWWQPVVAAAVLLVTVLVNANLTRRAGSGSSIGWALLRGPVATGLVTAVLGVAAIMLARLSSMTEYDTSFVWAVLEGMLVAVLVGLVSALVAQFQPSTPLAVLGALVGWTAATVANEAGWIVAPSGLATAVGSQWASTGVVVLSLLPPLLFGGVGGMAFALLGSLLGSRLRALAKNSAT